MGAWVIFMSMMGGSGLTTPVNLIRMRDTSFARPRLATESITMPGLDTESLTIPSMTTETLQDAN